LVVAAVKGLGALELEGLVDEPIRGDTKEGIGFARMDDVEVAQDMTEGFAFFQDELAGFGWKPVELNAVGAEFDGAARLLQEEDNFAGIFVAAATVAEDTEDDLIAVELLEGGGHVVPVNEQRSSGFRHLLSVEDLEWREGLSGACVEEVKGLGDGGEVGAQAGAWECGVGEHDAVN
jgi:hypothetical protein